MEKETRSEGETGESCAVEGSPCVEHSSAEFLRRARQFHLSLHGLEAVTRSGKAGCEHWLQVGTSGHGEASTCPSQDV